MTKGSPDRERVHVSEKIFAVQQREVSVAQHQLQIIQVAVELKVLESRLSGASTGRLCANVGTQAKMFQ